MSRPLHEPPRPSLGYRLMQAMAGPALKRMRLSCREFAFLCSLRMDRPLSFSERLRFRLHATMCGLCRLLPRQLEAIRSTVRSRSAAEPGEGCEASEPAPADGDRLGPEACRRIRSLLAAAAPDGSQMREGEGEGSRGTRGRPPETG